MIQTISLMGEASCKGNYMCVHSINSVPLENPH